MQTVKNIVQHAEGKENERKTIQMRVKEENKDIDKEERKDRGKDDDKKKRESNHRQD